jgi:hypothetical protein
VTAAGWSRDRSELETLRDYLDATLRKPQVVADNVLNGIFLADAAHRALLSALMVQEAAEAARRFNHVWLALADRSQPPVRRLAGPLPGAEDWKRLAATLALVEDPRQVLELLHLDDSVLDSIEELLDYGPLDIFTSLVQVTETGPPRTAVEATYPPTLQLANLDRHGDPVEVRIELADDRVIALGDATGDFVTWSRDFLEAYLDARGVR